MRSARTRATSMPSSVDSTDTTSDTLRPGRSTFVEIDSGVMTGTGRVNSIDSLAICHEWWASWPVSASTASTARASTALTGPPWQCRGSQGPRLSSVARSRVPSSSKSADDTALMMSPRLPDDTPRVR